MDSNARGATLEQAEAQSPPSHRAPRAYYFNWAIEPEWAVSQ